MLNKYAFLCISALLLTAGSRAQDDDVEDDEYADIDRAHLVVRKYMVEQEIVQGRTVTVNVDIFNSGSSTARKVQMTDFLPEGAILKSGEVGATWEKIAVGSHAKHSYTITFTTGGKSVQLPLAVIKYIPDDSEDVQVGRSSVPTFFVRTPVQHIVQYALHGGKYLSFGFAKSESDWISMFAVVGVVGGFFGINSAIKAAGTASTTRKRTQALADLKNL
eukprot:gene17564-23887_t